MVSYSTVCIPEKAVFNYAKEIIGGEAYVALSEEEKEAIERAKTLEDEIAENKLK